MTHVNDFFVEKKPWSILKDTIIDHYLKPYIAKILFTNRPLHLIDCFAGKGNFDDGSVGSPIIIAKHIKSMLENPHNRNKGITGHFVEKKYHQKLSENLSGYSNCEVLLGTFEDNLTNILEIPSTDNMFLYVDPYGIKSLDFTHFKLIRENNFRSLELLMNFNSIGFLREGLRLLKCEKRYEDEQEDDDYETGDVSDIGNMNCIANGDYWRRILAAYDDDKLSFSDAEEAFVFYYSNELRRLFKHVVNIPIKLKTKNIPKYRMMFCTNHEDGLILMANEMHKVWMNIVELERNGQGVLFELDFPHKVLGDGNLEREIRKIIEGNGPGGVLLEQLLAELIEHYGISYSSRDYTEKLKVMENEQIIISRKPEYTATNKKATSMDYKKYIIRLKSL